MKQGLIRAEQGIYLAEQGICSVLQGIARHALEPWSSRNVGCWGFPASR
jgi:hypothetical protein